MDAQKPESLNSRSHNRSHRMVRLVNDHKSASLSLFGSSIKAAIHKFSFEGILSVFREKLSASLSQVAVITTILSVAAGFAQGTMIAHQVDMELIKADLLGTQYYTNKKTATTIH